MPTRLRRENDLAIEGTTVEAARYIFAEAASNTVVQSPLSHTYS